MRNLIHICRRKRLVQIIAVAAALLLVVAALAWRSTEATSNVVSIHYSQYQTSVPVNGVDADWRVQYLWAGDSLSDASASTFHYATLTNATDTCGATTPGYKTYNEGTPLRIDDLNLDGTINPRPGNICFKVTANGATTYQKSRLKDENGVDIKMCIAQYQNGDNNDNGQCVSRSNNDGLIIYPNTGILTVNYQDGGNSGLANVLVRTYNYGYLPDGSFNRYYDACGKANFPIKANGDDIRSVAVSNTTVNGTTFKTGSLTLANADSGRVACAQASKGDHHYYARTTMIEVPAARAVTIKFTGNQLQASANFFIKDKDSWKWQAQDNATSCQGAVTGFQTIPITTADFGADISKDVQITIPANNEGKYICLAAQSWFASSYVFASPVLFDRPSAPLVSQQGRILSVSGVDTGVTSRAYQVLASGTTCDQAGYGSTAGITFSGDSLTIANETTDGQVYCLRFGNNQQLYTYVGLAVDLAAPGVTADQVSENTALVAKYSPTSETLTEFKYLKLVAGTNCDQTILTGALDYTYVASNQANNQQLPITPADHDSVYCFWVKDAVGNVGYTQHTVRTRGMLVEFTVNLQAGIASARLVNASGVDISSQVTDWRYTIFNNSNDCGLQIYYDIGTPGQIVGNSPIINFSSGYNGLKYCVQASLPASSGSGVDLVYSSPQAITGVPRSVPPVDLKIDPPTPANKTLLVTNTDPSASIWHYKVFNQTCNQANYDQSTATTHNYLLADKVTVEGRSRLPIPPTNHGQIYCFRFSNAADVATYQGVTINILDDSDASINIVVSQGYDEATGQRYVTAVDSLDLVTGAWSYESLIYDLVFYEDGSASNTGSNVLGCFNRPGLQSTAYTPGAKIPLATDRGYCFWKQHGQLDRFSLQELIPDLVGPTIDITPGNNLLQATSGNDEDTFDWQVAVLASDTVCNQDYQTEATAYTLGSDLAITASDNGKVYCFSARDSVGNYTYTGQVATYVAPAPPPEEEPATPPAETPVDNQEPDTPASEPEPEPEPASPPQVNLIKDGDQLVAEVVDGDVSDYAWAWVLTTSDQCDDQTDFLAANKRGTGNVALIEDSDAGLWYCFQAQKDDLTGYAQWLIEVETSTVTPVETETPSQPGQPVGSGTPVDSDPEDEGTAIWLIIALIAIPVVIVILIIVLLSSRGKGNKLPPIEDLPDEAPPASAGLADQVNLDANSRLESLPPEPPVANDYPGRLPQ